MGKTLDDFDHAIKTVTDVRGLTYGHPADNFALIATIKNALTCPDPRIKHALDMIAVNMARLCETPDYADGPIDIAGYAGTIAMIIDRDQNGIGKHPLQIHSIEEVDDV